MGDLELVSDGKTAGTAYEAIPNDTVEVADTKPATPLPRNPFSAISEAIRERSS